MIPLIKPVIPFEDVADDLRAILQSGQLTSGRYVADFESVLAKYVGLPHAVMTTSATTALHMAMVAMGLGGGDEVVVSDFSFPASGNSIVQTGAVPVFADCLPGRFDVDPDDLARRITPKCKAIMIVHPFGQPAEMSRINRIASRFGLSVIEDAACALGTRYRGSLCGSMSAVGCFSFHPRKLLSTGEGGAIVTADEELYRSINVLRSHGGERAEVGLAFIRNGFNYRMTEIQAALGLRQLPKLEAALIERRRLANLYLKRFAAISGVSVPLSSEPDNCTFQSFVLLLDDKIDRNRIVVKLREAQIESTLGTYAMHSQSAFGRFGYKAGDLPHSFRAQNQSLTLPLYAGMGDGNIDFIASTIAKLI